MYNTIKIINARQYIIWYYCKLLLWKNNNKKTLQSSVWLPDFMWQGMFLRKWVKSKKTFWRINRIYSNHLYKIYISTNYRGSLRFLCLRLAFWPFLWNQQHGSDASFPLLLISLWGCTFQSSLLFYFNLPTTEGKTKPLTDLHWDFLYFGASCCFSDCVFLFFFFFYLLTIKIFN